MTVQNEQIVNQPFYYINGLGISNDATTPNTIVDIAAGQCRDSTNAFDINLGNYLGVNPNLSANTVTTCNAAVNGANGLDTGSLAANTFYAVFVIADNLNRNQPATLMSKSWTAPLLPQGYGIFRRIGAVLTDGSSHILKFYQEQSNSNQRYMQYDAPIAVTVTASGTSATYSAMDLSVAVPLTNFGRTKVKFKYTNNAANDSLNFTPTGASGDYATYLGQTTGQAMQDQFEILPLIAASKPEVSYKVSAGTLNNVWVAGYQDLL